MKHSRLSMLGLCIAILSSSDAIATSHAPPSVTVWSSRGVRLEKPQLLKASEGLTFRGRVCRQEGAKQSFRILRLELVDPGGVLRASTTKVINVGRHGCKRYEVQTTWKPGAGDQVRLCRDTGRPCAPA